MTGGLPSFGIATVTIVRAGVTMVYDEPREDWDASTTHEIEGCSVQPGAGDTDVELRAGVRADYIVFMPVSADVTGRDHVELPGDDTTYAVIGKPGRWVTGLPNDHTMVALEGWEG